MKLFRTLATLALLSAAGCSPMTKPTVATAPPSRINVNDYLRYHRVDYWVGDSVGVPIFRALSATLEGPNVVVRGMLDKRSALDFSTYQTAWTLQVFVSRDTSVADIYWHGFDFIVPGQLMPAIYTFYPTRNGVLVGQGTFTHDERSFTLTLPVMVMRQGIVDVITDVYQLTPPQQGWLRWYVRTHAKDHDGYGPVKTDSIPEPEVATGWNP